MRFENIFFKTTIKRLDNICLKLVFWLKLQKKRLNYIVKIILSFYNILNIKKYCNI